jgi:hypothetical protein
VWEKIYEIQGLNVRLIFWDCTPCSVIEDEGVSFSIMLEIYQTSQNVAVESNWVMVPTIWMKTQ